MSAENHTVPFTRQMYWLPMVGLKTILTLQKIILIYYIFLLLICFNIFITKRLKLKVYIERIQSHSKFLVFARNKPNRNSINPYTLPGRFDSKNDNNTNGECTFDGPSSPRHVEETQNTKCTLRVYSDENLTLNYVPI